MSWSSTTTDGEDSGGAAGWSIGDVSYSRTTDDSGVWTTNSAELKIVVKGVARLSAPAVERAEVNDTELVLTFDDDLDTVSGTAEGAFAIKVDGGAAQAATAITRRQDGTLTCRP